VRLAAMLAFALTGGELLAATAQAATSPVPATIDPTGATDVTAALERFVDAVPDGATVVLRHGASYRIDGTLEWRDRTGVTLEGNGARLVAGTHGGPNRAHVRLIDGGRWTIRDLTVVGANRAGGHFDPKYQWQHGFDLRGVDGATLRNVTVSDVLGDDVYVGLSTTGARWSQDVSIIDSTGMRSGRMAIAVTAGRRVTVAGGRWSESGLSTFDVEPNGRFFGADRVLIEHTRIGPGSRDRVLDITGSGPVSNVTLRDNALVGWPLHVRVDQGDERPRNIIVQGNRSAMAFTGPPPAAMVFRNTDGITVSANTQPLGPGLAMVATEGSTRVAVSRRQYPYREVKPPGAHVGYVVGGVWAAAAVLAVLYRRRVRGRSRSGNRPAL
jgi:polygalacturonase